MASDEDENRHARRGEEAETLMANPLLVETLEFLEKKIIDGMKILNCTDLEGRDALWRELRALSSIKKQIKYYAIRGREAKKTLAERLKQQFRG